MKDLTEGKLESALVFAKSIGTESLERAVEHIKNMDELYPQETTIMNDFAPHSFYFEKKSLNEGRVIGNGGIIFHDIQKGVGTAGVPSFSVSIEDDITKHWQIHT